MISLAEQALSASLAATETAAIKGPALELRLGAVQELGHIFSGGSGGAPLELNGLAQARQRGDRDAPGARVSGQEVADEEIAAVIILDVFVHDQADKEIAASLFLLVGAEPAESLSQHLVSRAIANLVNDILVHLRQSPRLADRRASLGSHSEQAHIAADGNGDAPLFEHLAIKVDLRRAIVEVAAGQTAEDGQRCVARPRCPGGRGR